MYAYNTSNNNSTGNTPNENKQRNRTGDCACVLEQKRMQRMEMGEKKQIGIERSGSAMEHTKNDKYEDDGQPEQKNQGISLSMSTQRKFNCM